MQLYSRQGSLQSSSGLVVPECPLQHVAGESCTTTCGLHKLSANMASTKDKDGKGAKEQVKVVGPRYNNTGDSGHTDLKHVSQHLLLQACSNSAAEEKKLIN
ncbi:hypothetical protein AALO_G00138350 [Alosa alosa]|uniref:Uncharacterized protein n=1 Tax=Alosa alosa TaxID=278164 RepID=A0AAV6GHH5_9TELE|nr:hypothetical protein AALO_G00138350 [Alosa alosa]